MQSTPFPSLAEDARSVAPATSSWRALLAAPISRATWFAAGEAVIGFLASFLGLALVILALVSVSLVPALGIGFPLLALTFLAVRGLAALERSRLAAQLGPEIAAPVRPAGARRPWWSPAAWWGEIRSSRTWAQLGYLALWTPLASVRFVALGGVAWGAAFLSERLRPAAGAPLRLAVVILALGLSVWLFALLTQALALLQLRLGRALLGRSAAQEAAAEARAAAERAAQAEERAEHLSETRSRAVGAADEERRRIERDLHDGAQQRLVALGVELGVAKRRAAGDPEAAAAALDHAHEEIKATLVELRDLVRGIHPAVLTDRGLDAALSALAARSPVPVAVEVPDPESLATASSAAQAAAYFVAAEALTNAAKHARASEALVRASVVGDRLRLEVADDGVGGADPAPGSGLDGLRARVEALDGSFDLDSPAGAGTRLTVEVPCAS